MITLTRVGNNVHIEVNGNHVGTCQNMHASTVRGEARYALAAGLYFPHHFSRRGSALVSESSPSVMYRYASRMDEHLTQFPSLWAWSLSEQL